MIKTIYSLCFLSLMLVFFTNSHAQNGQESTHAFDISQAVKYGLDNQYKIKTSRFDEYIAQTQVDYLLGLGLPQVSGSINLQGNIQNPKFILQLPGAPAPTKITAGQPFQHTAGANLNQLLFDGTFFLGLKASKEFVNLSEIMTQRTEIEVINNVVSAYYAALTAKEGGALLDLNLQRLENLYKDTDAMYRNGLVEKIDLDRIQISINNLRTEKQKFERMVNLTIELLKFQMAMPVEHKLVLTESLPKIDVEHEDIANLRKIDFSKRVETSLINQQELLENYNRRRYQMAYYPSIYGFAFYQFNMQGKNVFIFNENTTYSQSAAGIKINVPIFDGFRTRAKIQESTINLDKIKVSREVFERGTQMEMENAITTLQNSRDTYKAQTENVELARNVYTITQVKYKEGAGTSLEVNNAELAIKEAERNRLSAQLDYLNARLKVEIIKGELKEKYVK